MIRLNKGQIPPILSSNKEDWDSIYKEAIRNGGKCPRYYAHGSIKDALKTETNGKCAYCEAKSAHVSWGDVEHIRPKATNENLVHDWLNLTYACSICNNNKSDYDSEPRLINPYSDDPEDFLMATGPVINGILGAVRGELTIRMLGLNREELFLRRCEKIESLNILLNRWSEASGPLKDLLWQELLKEVSADKEFSFVLKKYLSDRTGVT